MINKRSILVFVTIAALIFSAATAAQAQVPVRGQGLLKAGPLVNGPLGVFPAWFMDKTGTAVEACLTGPPFCLSSLADLGNPAIGEAFYWSASAVFPGTADLVEIALEAAFFDATAVPFVTRANAQIFNRIRTRIDALAAPGRYTLRHPYGQRFITAEPDPANLGRFRLNETDDFPGTVGPASFLGVLRSTNIGPFLKTVPRPGGRLGDAVTPRRVTGGPNGNSVQLIAPNGTVVRNTSLWTIEGKLATNGGLSGVAANYSRSTAGSGTINVGAISIGGQRIVALIQNGAIFRLVNLAPVAGEIGKYSAAVPFTAAQQLGSVTLRNMTDARRPFITIAKVPDKVTITKATFLNGVLSVSAVSSDLKVPRPMLQLVDGAGNVVVTPAGPVQRRGSLAASITVPNPGRVTVRSSAGGTATAVVR